MSKKIFLTLFVSILGFSLHADTNNWDYTEQSSCYNDCLFYFGAEGLWWTVCQTNLDFGVDVSSEDENTRDKLVGSGSHHYLDYDWKAGGSRS